jgi:hypothetical protein
MAPTYRAGDHLLVWWGPPWPPGLAPRPGRAVVARLPRVEGLSVKRVARRFTDGRWWLLGDDAASSVDSRVLGAVPAQDVRGVVLGVLRRPGRA